MLSKSEGKDTGGELDWSGDTGLMYAANVCNKQVACSSCCRWRCIAPSKSHVWAVEPVPKPVPLAQYCCWWDPPETAVTPGAAGTAALLLDSTFSFLVGADDEDAEDGPCAPGTPTINWTFNAKKKGGELCINSNYCTLVSIWSIMR